MIAIIRKLDLDFRCMRVAFIPEDYPATLCPKLDTVILTFNCRIDVASILADGVAVSIHAPLDVWCELFKTIDARSADFSDQSVILTHQLYLKMNDMMICADAMPDCAHVTGSAKTTGREVNFEKYAL